MASVSLEGVSKVYAGGVQAVSDLNLEVAHGELLVLIGPSGCGKTTTLRMIAGLEHPTSGEIRLAGELMSLAGELMSLAGKAMSHVPPHHRDVAMVFQEDALQPHWTVRGNLAFGLKMAHGRRGGNAAEALFIKGTTERQRGEKPLTINQGEIDQRIGKVAHLLGIEQLLDRRPWQLSGGERQRIALGRAIIRSPGVLLLDEPLAHLDASLRDQLRMELRRLKEALATTMIYVTHDWQEAMSLGDRIAVLDKGKLQQIGPPLQVFDRPQTLAVAGLLGSPPMNFIAGQLVGNEQGVRFVGGGWSVAFTASQSARLAGMPSREVVVGVRPQHLRVQPASDAPAATNLAKISMVETLGDSTILRLRPEKTAVGVLGTDLTVCETGRRQWRKDDKIAVIFEAENCHVFDSDSKQNLVL